jgi:purine-binding chemotaxis protein CheW
MSKETKADNKNLLQGLESDGDQYLSFRLAGETYGVDILRVQEIRGWERVTRVPNAPRYVLGVVNLRGSIVPIFDLRLRFNLPAGHYSKDTVVIVLMTHQAGGGMRSIGLVVDAVSDVINASGTDIAVTPEFGGRISTEWIAGLASTVEQMIMLLDVDKMFAELDEDHAGEEHAA